MEAISLRPAQLEGCWIPSTTLDFVCVLVHLNNHKLAVCWSKVGNGHYHSTARCSHKANSYVLYFLIHQLVLCLILLMIFHIWFLPLSLLWPNIYFANINITFPPLLKLGSPTLPWNVHQPIICLHLSQYCKFSNRVLFKFYAMSHILGHSPAQFIYADGSKGRPGVGCAAVSVDAVL